MPDPDQRLSSRPSWRLVRFGSHIRSSAAPLAPLSRRVQGLGVPLEQPLGVGEGAVLLGVAGGRDEEHLGLDVAGRRAGGVVLPEHRRLGLEPVRDDQPVEVPQPGPLQPGVQPAAGRVLADGLYRRQAPDLDRLDAELGRLIGTLRT